MATATARARKPKDVLTTGEIAAHCRVAPRTVSKWIDSGTLKGWKIPGSQDRRVLRAEFARWLVRHGMPPLEGATALAVGLEGGDLATLRDALGLPVESVATAFAAGAGVAALLPPLVVVDLDLGRLDAETIAQGVRATLPAARLAAVGAPDAAAPRGFDAVLCRPLGGDEMRELRRLAFGGEGA